MQDSAAQDSIITIEGGNFCVSGDDSHRVFLVQEYGDLSINNLIVTNGRSTNGGAIKVDGGGILSLSGVTVKDSEATGGPGGGIRADGELTMTNSAVHGNESSSGQIGGGLALRADATITNSAIYNNSSDHDGGGVDMSFSSASVTISGSSIYGNSAAAGGGGFMVADTTELILKNSTVYGNSAEQGAALRVVSGTATVTHVTFVDNRVSNADSAAVLRVGDTLRLRNSIIARTTANNGTTRRVDCSGVLGQNINNQVQDGSCSAAFMGGPGLASAPTGSPPYYALQVNSPAIGQGDAAVCAAESTDQAGQARPASGCDLGAVQYIAPTVVQRGSSSDSSSGGSGGDDKETTTTRQSIPTGYTLVIQGYQLAATYGLGSGVQFKRVDASGVGNQAVIDLGLIDAIDVWGYVEQGVHVCFPQKAISSSSMPPLRRGWSIGCPASLSPPKVSPAPRSTGPARLP